MTANIPVEDLRQERAVTACKGVLTQLIACDILIDEYLSSIPVQLI